MHIYHEATVEVFYIAVWTKGAPLLEDVLEKVRIIDIDED
jgi:hypothetical protein